MSRKRRRTPEALPSTTSVRSTPPPFVHKLHYQLLPSTKIAHDDGHIEVIPSCKYIYWDPNENWLVVDKRNPKKLKAVLIDPNFGEFKSDKFPSFQRQLLNYGFEKVDEYTERQQRKMQGMVAFRHPKYNPNDDNTMWCLVDSKDEFTKMKKKTTDDLREQIEQLNAELNDSRAREAITSDKLRRVEQTLIQCQKAYEELMYRYQQVCAAQVCLE